MGWLASLLVSIIRTRLLFMVNDGNEDKADLFNPAKYSLDNAHNVYFTGYQDETERMGGWFISPHASQEEGHCTKDSCPSQLFNSQKLKSSDTVFLLLHGNAKNRGASHRIAAYKTFQSLGFYTLTIDYRGYGDSIRVGELSESTVVEDALKAIRELRVHLGDKFKLILYGHSMGSGISTHAAVLAQNEGLKVDGVLLDSPFHSMAWNFNNSKSLYVVDYLLGLGDALIEADIAFDSVSWLKQIKVPMRILHAEVDQVCPIQCSVDLVNDAHQAGKHDINLVRFSEEGLGHIGISTTQGFKQEISDFANLV